MLISKLKERRLKGGRAFKISQNKAAVIYFNKKMIVLEASETLPCKRKAEYPSR